MSVTKSYPKGTKRFMVHKIRGREGPLDEDIQDTLVVEEPLEIRIAYGLAHMRKEKSISITMRTPGHDFELAAGFLYTEGVIHSLEDLNDITYSKVANMQTGQCNVVSVHLQPKVRFDPKLLERHFYTNSSCGVCGKATLEALRIRNDPIMPGNGHILSHEIIERMAKKLRPAQKIFQQTGALHAAGLFDFTGNLISLHEDVGRHNAVDKVIGERLLKNQVPLRQYLLLVSGRASFEIIQKALSAGIPIVAAVSAPSSLAVELAIDFNMTLLGFVRDGNYNIYAGAERIQASNRRT